MNAPFNHDQLSNDLASMGGLADKWRGECIQQFAELEQIVEGLLLELARAPKHGKLVKTGQPVGAAFKHLRDLTAGNGPFGGKGKAISRTLSDLAPWFEWRAHLTHGSLSLWRGRENRWLLAFAHRSNGDGTVRTHAITWEDANSLKSLLLERSPLLRENARSLANSVRKP